MNENLSDCKKGNVYEVIKKLAFSTAYKCFSGGFYVSEQKNGTYSPLPDSGGKEKYLLLKTEPAISTQRYMDGGTDNYSNSPFPHL